VFVTDRSTVRDFFIDEPFPQVQVEVDLGVAVSKSDYIWEIAERLKEKEQ
jgi:hypothetical protein